MDDPGRKYTRDDLQILGPLEVIQVIRQRPGMYLRSGRFTPEEAVEQLVGAALLCGATTLSIERLTAGWWVVWSTQDWLPTGNTRSVFERIVPFPEAGQNSMRPEVLLTAFAADVVTASAEGTIVVKGTVDDDLTCFISRIPQVGRLIAFRV